MPNIRQLLCREEQQQDVTRVRSEGRRLCITDQSRLVGKGFSLQLHFSFTIHRMDAAVVSPCRGLRTGRLTAFGRSWHLELLLCVIAL